MFTRSWDADLGGLAHKVESPDEIGFEVGAGNDGVEETVFEKELGALKAFGELLADGLLDDAGAGEGDERAGFGDVEVAEHGEAGGDAAGGGVGEQADVRDGCLVKLGEAGGDFGELHETDDALHHACAAGCGDDDEWFAAGQGSVDCAGDVFTDDGTHAAADEGVLHGAQDDFVWPKLAEGGDDGVVQTGLLLGDGEALFVGLDVVEVQWVSRAEVAVDDGVSRLEEGGDALGGADLEVVAALGADAEVGFELGFEERSAAAGALDPETLGADAGWSVFVVGDGGVG